MIMISFLGLWVDFLTLIHPLQPIARPPAWVWRPIVTKHMVMWWLRGIWGFRNTKSCWWTWSWTSWLLLLTFALGNVCRIWRNQNINDWWMCGYTLDLFARERRHWKGNTGPPSPWWIFCQNSTWSKEFSVCRSSQHDVVETQSQQPIVWNHVTCWFPYRLDMVWTSKFVKFGQMNGLDHFGTWF